MTFLHRLVAEFATPMDHDNLRVFLHLARSLHFGRTGKALHKSVSAVSRIVRRLEHELGQPLFERDNRTVKLTAHGEALARHAGDELARWRNFQDQLRGGSAGLHGNISVFASVTACQSFLPPLLARFRADHPQVKIKLETGYAVDALDKLREGEVDVTVAALPERVPAHLVSRVIEVTPLIFVCTTGGSEVARQVDRRNVDWSNVPLVLPAQGLARMAVDKWFRARRMRPNIYSEVMGNEAILALVATGSGIGVVPALVLEKSPLKSDVRALAVNPPLGEFRVGLCTQRRALAQPAIAAFWNAMG
jgi:LysR family transcriptional regulator, positive regulator for ilvC